MPGPVLHTEMNQSQPPCLVLERSRFIGVWGGPLRQKAPAGAETEVAMNAVGMQGTAQWGDGKRVISDLNLSSCADGEAIY